MERVVSVWLPAWSLDRIRRLRRLSGPEHDDNHPFVLTEPGSGGPRICALNARAHAAGIRPGWCLADARACVRDLAFAPVDSIADARALRQLAMWMRRWTPRTACDGYDGMLLDISGCAHLFGGEEAMLEQIAHCLSRAGISCRLALADTPAAAWALARHAQSAATATATATAGGVGGAGVVGVAGVAGVAGAVGAVGAVAIFRCPPGGQKEALASLPVAALRLSDAAVCLLLRVGLTSIGALFAIARPSLARRFAGADAVLTRLDQAMGCRTETFVALQPPPDAHLCLPCPEPLCQLAGVRAGLDMLLPRLCRRLAGRGRAARAFSFSAFRCDGQIRTVHVRTAHPVREAGHIGSLFAEKLAGIDPGDGIDCLLLEATHSVCVEARTGALLPHCPAGGGDEGDSREGLGRLVDRLALRVEVQVFHPRASHIPERSECRKPFDGVLSPSWVGPYRGMRPVRLFASPEPIEVLAELPDAPPVRFVWRGVVRRVARADGPERLAPEWWRLTDALVRDYYRIEDHDGQRFWLFRHGLYGCMPSPPRWYMHGCFG